MRRAQPSNSKRTPCLFIESSQDMEITARPRPNVARRPPSGSSRVNTVVPRAQIPDGVQWIELPEATPSYLTSRPDGLELTSSSHGCDVETLLLEPVRHDHRPYVLLIARQLSRVRVNGSAASTVNMLRVKDVVDFAGFTLHLSLLNRPYVGPPCAEQIGLECSYCRLQINEQPDTRVYVCPTCQSPMHCQDVELPVETRLECARLVSHCGSCQSPILLEEGFVYVPETFI